MSEFGFKQITPDNWLQPDPILRGFDGAALDGTAQLINAQDLLPYILGPNLAHAVPKDIRVLFEVARGSMVYGFLFYPLFTLSVEQLFRIAETAVTHKCKELSAPAEVRSFAQKVDYLFAEAAIPGSERTRWEAIRWMRNKASHPERQDTVTPFDAILLLGQMAAIINGLFGGPTTRSS